MSSSPQNGPWVELTCDGNRRYGVAVLAEQAGIALTPAQLDEAQAYACNNAGGEATKKIIETARDEMVGLMALWVWSTKNWNRSEAQRTAVFRVIDDFLKDLETRWMDLPENSDVRLVHMGRTGELQKYAPEMIARMERIVEKTRERSGMVVALLMDYSGPDEDVRARTLWKEKNCEGLFEDCLDLPRAGVSYRELDLRIRTGETSDIKHANAVMRPYEGMETRDIFHSCLLAQYTPEMFQKDIAAFRKTEKKEGK